MRESLPGVTTCIASTLSTLLLASAMAAQSLTQTMQLTENAAVIATATAHTLASTNFALVPGRTYVLTIVDRATVGGFPFGTQAGIQPIHEHVAEYVLAFGSAPTFAPTSSFSLTAGVGVQSVGGPLQGQSALDSGTGLPMHGHGFRRETALGCELSSRSRIDVEANATNGLSFSVRLEGGVGGRFTTQVGTYAVSALNDVSLEFQVAAATTLTLSATNALRGATQALPYVSLDESGRFSGAPSGAWFDPPMAIGFDFQRIGTTLFTDVLTLPVGIDGDGLFEVIVGTQSLGPFAQGSRVDFRQLLGGNGVTSFRVLGIDPAVDATDLEGFPIRLAFQNAVGEFAMTPVLRRAVGTFCSDATACPACPAIELTALGTATIGNPAFSLALQNVEPGSLVGFHVGIGQPRTSPLPLLCGAVHLPTPAFDLGIATATGPAGCGGTATLALPLPADAALVGLVVTMQSAFVCPAGGLGLSQALEFAIGS